MCCRTLWLQLLPILKAGNHCFLQPKNHCYIYSSFLNTKQTIYFLVLMILVWNMINYYQINLLKNLINHFYRIFSSNYVRLEFKILYEKTKFYTRVEDVLVTKQIVGIHKKSKEIYLASIPLNLLSLPSFSDQYSLIIQSQ